MDNEKFINLMKIFNLFSESDLKKLLNDTFEKLIINKNLLDSNSSVTKTFNSANELTSITFTYYDELIIDETGMYVNNNSTFIKTIILDFSVLFFNEYFYNFICDVLKFRIKKTIDKIDEIIPFVFYPDDFYAFDTNYNYKDSFDKNWLHPIFYINDILNKKIINFYCSADKDEEIIYSIPLNIVFDEIALKEYICAKKEILDNKLKEEAEEKILKEKLELEHRKAELNDAINIKIKEIKEAEEKLNELNKNT